MISETLRQTIVCLHERGVALREICQIVKCSRNTVRRALRPSRQSKPGDRSKYLPVVELLPELLHRCKHNRERVCEVLASEHGVVIPYSTLTWLIREQALNEPKPRSGEYHFGPGEEMQHDTSPHSILLNGQTHTLQCASLVLAYCRVLYVQYYLRFTRFEAKEFLAHAFRFMQGTCKRCTIDNTSVLLAGGSGPDAQIAPEMEAFGACFGVTFIPHAVGHSDRKGRVERPFYYVETNFLAGRQFIDLDDLNRQALAWCEQVANAKSKRRLGMSPQAAYVLEKPYLTPLPSLFPPILQIHHRRVDTQGFVHLETNRYSIPERYVGQPVEIHLYPRQVQVYCRQQLVAEHPRLLGKRYGRCQKPDHHPLPVPRQSTGPSQPEVTLRGQHDRLDNYITELKRRCKGRGTAKLQRLLTLQRRYPDEPFLAAIEQALHYGLFDLTRLENMILERVAGDFFALGEDD